MIPTFVRSLVVPAATTTVPAAIAATMPATVAAVITSAMPARRKMIPAGNSCKPDNNKVDNNRSPARFEHKSPPGQPWSRPPGQPPHGSHRLVAPGCRCGYGHRRLGLVQHAVTNRVGKALLPQIDDLVCVQIVDVPGIFDVGDDRVIADFRLLELQDLRDAVSQLRRGRIGCCRSRRHRDRRILCQRRCRRPSQTVTASTAIFFAKFCVFINSPVHSNTAHSAEFLKLSTLALPAVLSFSLLQLAGRLPPRFLFLKNH